MIIPRLPNKKIGYADNKSKIKEFYGSYYAHKFARAAETLLFGNKKEQARQKRFYLGEG